MLACLGLAAQNVKFADSYENVTQWYFWSMRKGFVSYNPEGKTPSAQFPESATNGKTAGYYWGFVGTKDNFRLVNRAAGPGKYLAGRGTSGQGSAPMKMDGTGVTYRFVATTNSNHAYGDYYIRTTQNATEILNDVNGSLGYWYHERAKDDTGSQVTFAEADLSGLVELIEEVPQLENDSMTYARLCDMDLTLMENGWGTIQKDKSINGNTLTTGGKSYRHGVGAHATNRIVLNLNAAKRFHAVVGLDDETSGGNVKYSVVLKKQNGEEKTVASGTLTTSSQKSRTATIDVETTGYKYMILLADENGANSYDHVDWADAWFVYNKVITTEPFVIHPRELEPGLDCATHVFAQPGVRFMHKIKANSDEAMLSASGLPEGLTWNAGRNLIEGQVKEAGTYSYTVTCNVNGRSTEQPIRLEVSDKLAQPTPFMGLLTWNVFEHEISEDKVIAIAEAFEEYGLLEAGYEYICLDDQWALKERDANGRLQYAPAKFPNGLNSLADIIHGKGMKFGVYSDGGSYTCSGAQPGSYQHEATDAKSFNDWGFDLLKYDYCNNPGSSTAVAKQVYGAMGDGIRRQCRPDFIFYLCEWGYRNPWEWGAETGGTCWRCTDDTRDCWTNPTYKGGVKDNIDIFKSIWQYNGPNRFNDADMVMCGLHGTGKSSNAGTNGKGMTQEEYKTQFALWCMWSSPITLSFDVTTLGGKKGVSGVTNPFYKEDLAMITNRDLIALNQDRLGQSGEPVYDTPEYIVFMKDLENGDVAISVTNLSTTERSVKLDFADFPAMEKGRRYLMHDCWTGMDTDKVFGTTDSYTTPALPAHGTVVYRMRVQDAANGIQGQTSKKKELTEDRTYDLRGLPAEAGVHGIVMNNNKKYIRK